MSNSIDTQNQTLELQPFDHNSNGYRQNNQEWETMARAWLSTMPEGKTTMSEFEAWLDSNHAYFPEEIKSMPRSVLYERLNSIQNSVGPSNYEEKDANQAGLPPARFQRTDQWMPVYSWLESLDACEVIKSKDILDWLSENPEIKEQLYKRHSRYHLMHYIKKCHVKILKRKEKKKGLQPPNKANIVKVHKNEGKILPVPHQCHTSSSLPKDGDMYLAKRNEAFRKFEILVELEKELSILFPKCENVHNLAS